MCSAPGSIWDTTSSCDRSVSRHINTSKELHGIGVSQKTEVRILTLEAASRVVVDLIQ